MSINVFKKIALLGFMAASTSVFAGPLNDYNLILSGDLSPSSDVHLHGKTFVGGNLKKVSISGSDLPSSSDSTDTLEVVGNVDATATDLHLKHGSLAYGGSLIGSVDCQSVPNCTRQVSGLSAKRDVLFAELQAESNYYKSLVSTGLVNNSDLNQSKFVYSGAATDLAVFDITGASLFNSNGWDAILGSAKNIVINVSGTNINMSHNVNLMGNLGNSSIYDNVLWNFYEATNITFNNRWAGSVLAVNAVIDIKNSDFDGSVAAKSYIGNGQIHDYHWSYTPPKTNVPEPSSLLLSLFGLGLVLLGRARRRK
jgi:choice-of-anchor A domain-containing protein